MANAVHTNHFSLLYGNGHIRMACSEQLHPDIQPIPHSILLIPEDNAMELAGMLFKTLKKFDLENNVLNS